MTTTQTMTTQQAYMKAFELDKKGMKHKQIALELARAGYVSFKTGRALQHHAISNMVQKVREGFVPQNRVIRSKKNRAWRYQPRPRGSDKAAKTTTVAPTSANGGLSLPKTVIADTFIDARKGAEAELTAMAHRFRSMANSIDTLLGAVR